MLEDMMQRKDKLLKLMNANQLHANRFEELTTVIELYQFRKESVRKTDIDVELENSQIKDIP